MNHLTLGVTQLWFPNILSSPPPIKKLEFKLNQNGIEQVHPPKVRLRQKSQVTRNPLIWVIGNKE